MSAPAANALVPGAAQDDAAQLGVGGKLAHARAKLAPGRRDSALSLSGRLSTTVAIAPSRSTRMTVGHEVTRQR